MTIKLYSKGAYEWQHKAHQVLDSSPAGTVVVIKAARQIYGKTQFCLAALVKICLEQPGCDCAYISPTLGLAKEKFDQITKKLGGFVCKGNGATKKIHFDNGSRISFFSAEQGDALRGFNCTGLLVVDECAFIQDNVWNELVAPWTLVHKPKVIMISTPLFKDGFFWNAFCSDTNIVLDWTELYPLPETDFLLEQKRNMPLRKYLCEFRGQWLEADGAVFYNFNDLLIEPEQKPTQDALYFGIDWGSGSNGDETVLVGFNSNNEMKVLKRWKNTPPTEQIKEITAVLKQFRVHKIVAEENSIGKVYLDLLRKNFAVIGFNTSNDTKRQIIDNFRKLVEQKQVKLINDKELIKQMAFYQEERTPTGKITYNAQKGKHDDIVMATAIALHAKNVGSCIRII